MGNLLKELKKGLHNLDWEEKEGYYQSEMLVEDEDGSYFFNIFVVRSFLDEMELMGLEKIFHREVYPSNIILLCDGELVLQEEGDDEIVDLIEERVDEIENKNKILVNKFLKSLRDE